MSDPVDSFLAEWATAERTGDAARLDPLLTDDFRGVGPLGFVLSKAAWLARFSDGLAYETLHLEEAESRRHDCAALITARQTGRGTFQGHPLPFEAVRATLALVSPGGLWQLAGIHMSFIAGTRGAPAVPGAGSPPAGREEDRQ